MKNSKEIIIKSGIIPKLHLGVKVTEKKDGRDVQVVRSTGPHRVKFIADKERKGTDKESGQEIDVVSYLVEENGEKRSYVVPKFDKRSGEVHYLVQRLADINEGEEVILEMKRRGFKNYIEVIPVSGSKEVELSDDEVEDDEEPKVTEEQLREAGLS